MTRGRWSGIALIGISIAFALRTYVEAPWYLNTTDFLIRPILAFALPLGLIGVVLWFLPRGRRTVDLFAVGLLTTGMLVLWLQGGWPEPQLPTAWEDSYQNLYAVGIIVKQLCWPLWIIFSLYLLYNWRNTRIS